VPVRLLTAALALLVLAVPAAASTQARVVPTLVAAGDIGRCDSDGDDATAALVRARPRAVVATLGDLAYERGRPDEFERCYGPSWGPFKSRTRPTPGNHEYGTSGASGYFDYFGKRAGTPGRGWYSYRLGTWLVVALNSNCDQVGGCGRGSAQERWLRRTLAANRVRCTLAYWHHPRFSSGNQHGATDDVEELWRALYAAGADVVLSGHDHIYERFALQTADGSPATGRGLRQFVVGTGGAGLHGFTSPKANSQARVVAYGVLALSLAPGRYAWRFVDVAGRVKDAGSAPCVRAR
jgi:3',5'-cyclic AMP phosphodiesterase CpdA